MAAKKNGNGNLENALAQLIQNQAILLSMLTEDHKRLSKNEQDHLDLKREIGERLGNIEALLIRHEQTLEKLPEAIRQKIGFKKA